MANRYVMFAAYNRWANERVYDAASQLNDTDYRAERGAFFGSVHRTLNHLLVADRIWMQRFTAQGDAPSRLDAILFDDFGQLRHARQAEDERIARWIGSLSDADLAGRFRYRPITNPAMIEQDLAPALDHFFNHQTHHRGQLHCLITQLAGVKAGPVLDLIAFQREAGFGGVRKLD
jgi:uncharacterized damage-inducible protein DinB